MFGRASGKSKLLKTHDDADCMLLRCARGIRTRAHCNDESLTHSRAKAQFCAVRAPRSVGGVAKLRLPTAARDIVGIR